MKRDGIDISFYRSNNIDEYKNIDFDFIITVCDNANENCPLFFSKNSKRIHQNFIDPSKIRKSKNIEKDFDDCRDEIKKFSKEFKKIFFNYLTINCKISSVLCSRINSLFFKISFEEVSLKCLIVNKLTFLIHSTLKVPFKIANNSFSLLNLS